MTTTAQKANYVRSATADEHAHQCHWPGCGKAVPPAMWGCKNHWFRLPRDLRTKIWATYRPGQEISKTPSANYVKVAKQVQNWISEHVV